MQLSGTGVWAHQLRYGDAGAVAELAAELDELGYAAIWIPDVGGDVLGAIETLLGATPRIDDRDRHPQRLDARAGRGRGAARVVE